MPNDAIHESGRGRQTRHIVIVDAHDDSRAMYAEYFEWMGVPVTTSPTAAGALRVIRRELPDAVITCLRLSDMDGFGLCHTLREMPRTKRIPVIGISTCLLDHERAARDHCFAAVVMKPCLPEDLLESLHGNGSFPTTLFRVPRLTRFLLARVNG